MAALALTATGCKSDGEPPESATAAEARAAELFQPVRTRSVDEEAVRNLENDLNSDAFVIETANHVDALSHGLVGDGVTDNTAVFRALLSGGGKTIRVPAGDYVTDRLELEANTILILEPGVTIRDAGRLGKYDRLLNIESENVRITGFGARVISDRRDYQEYEWRHGVHIFGAHRVLVEGLDSSDHGGDGFYIGGPPGNPSTDVVLRGCRANNNRRQGLSITSARRVRVVDCEFTNTAGTAPQFGVDLEPNAPVDYVDDIVLIRPYTAANVGGDIMINLQRHDASSYPSSVLVADHVTDSATPNIYIDVPSGVQADLQYTRLR